MLSRLSHFLIIAVAVFGFCAPAGVDAQDIDVQGQTIGSIDGLKLGSDPNDASTLVVRLTANFPSFTHALDHILVTRGNLGSCSKRLYWVGNTSIREDGASLALSSRLRYEQWACGLPIIGDKRIFRDTKTVDWRVFVVPALLDNLRVTAQVENVRNLQNDLEERLDLRVREEISIPLPAYCGVCECSEIMDALRPTVEAAQFSHVEDDMMRLTISFSMASDLSRALDCLR